MLLGTIRPIALSHLSQAFRSLVISRRCHSALYGCWLHNFLPEVSPGSLARVQVLGRHSGCRAWGALRARGSPLSYSILSEFGSALMVQGLGSLEVDDQLKLHRLLHGQIGGFGTFEDLIHEIGYAAEPVASTHRIGHQPSRLHKVSLPVHRRQPILCGELDQPCPVSPGYGGSQHDEGLGVLPGCSL